MAEPSPKRFCGLRPRVILLGDSLTQQSFAPNGWGAALADAYQRRCDVLNRGYSGYNSRWVLQLLRSGGGFPGDSADAATRVVTLLLGANDAVLEGEKSQYVPLEEYKSNLRDIVSIIRERCPLAKILIICPPPVCEWQRLEFQKERFGDQATGKPERTNENTGRYAAAALEVAAQLSLPSVNLWKLMQEVPFDWSEFLCDGLHFTEKGNTFVGKAVLREISASLPNVAVVPCKHTGAYGNSGSSSEIAIDCPFWDDLDLENPLKSLVLLRFLRFRALLSPMDACSCGEESVSGSHGDYKFHLAGPRECVAVTGERNLAPFVLMAPEKRVPVQGDWISGSSMAALAFLLQVTEDDEDEALEAEALDGPGVELGAGRGLLGLGCAAAGMLVEVTDLEEEICGALRRSVGASDLGAGCAVRRFDWDEGLEAYGGLQPPNENLAPRLVLGAELLWAEDAVDPLLEAVLPVVLAGASFVYGFSQRPSNELFMRKLQAVEGTRLERRSFRVETKCLGCGGWQTREQCSVAIWSCIEPPFSGKMGLLAGWLVGRVVAFLATILSTRPRCPGRSFGDFGEASVGRWVLRCTGWWHAVPQPGLVARTLEFPSLGGDGLGVHFAWKAEGRRPKSENLGVSLELEQEIEKLGGLMELSASQEAVEEFKAMAKNLAREFKEKVAHPNAEAFIEQLCVEKILKGALFVGHVKTDLDSVAGAIGGACLYQGTACRAERELNGEIMYALRWAGLEMPPYFDDLPGAMEPDAEGNLKSICLVDHNEDKQMVPSLRDAKDRKKRIIGLIDHHALAESMASEKPLFMDVRPWGSMSSIVAHAFIRGNRMIPKPVARILLAAILSDTLNLQSVTTTNADRFLVTVLCILGECEDPDQLARAMFRAKTEWIVNLGAYEMTRGDQKDFTASGWKVGIAVLEVTDTCPVLKVAEELLMELRILKVEKGQLQEGKHDRRKELDFAYLFVVDVTKQESFLLIAGGRELALAKEAFPGKRLREAKEGILAPGDTIQADETLMEVGGLVSRKAQFVPAFLSALNGGFSCHKQPNSLIAEELAGIREEDEVTEAIDAMQKDSFHDSVQVVRDYTRYRHALDTLIVRKSIIAQGDSFCGTPKEPPDSGSWCEGFGRKRSRKAKQKRAAEAAFLHRLALQYFGWWLAIALVPAVFLDHHRCEASMPYLAWFLYGATVLAMLVMALLLELAMVQRLGLLQAGELHQLLQDKWRRPLASTVLWKLDSYTDVAFIFIARDCGSSLWWASLAAVIFCAVFCQMIFNTCFACSDCDGELPPSFGFVLFDFKLVNTAVRSVVPFDPDASDLPVAKPVTLRSSASLVGLEKVVGDVAQVCIQSLFLMSATAPHGFVIFSIAVGALNGGLSILLIVQDAVRQEWAVQANELEQGTVLAKPSPGALHEGPSTEMPTLPLGHRVPTLRETGTYCPRNR
ncbi:unnamed protein product [Effrenium voratum]|nr:unnamed protein product [Effrenium voratum]